MLFRQHRSWPGLPGPNLLRIAAARRPRNQQAVDSCPGWVHCSAVRKENQHHRHPSSNAPGNKVSQNHGLASNQGPAVADSNKERARDNHNRAHAGAEAASSKHKVPTSNARNKLHNGVEKSPPTAINRLTPRELQLAPRMQQLRARKTLLASPTIPLVIRNRKAGTSGVVDVAAFHDGTLNSTASCRS